MINQLYTFSGGSYVVADDWNANFGALNTSNENCGEAIEDAQDALAFPNSDLSSLFAALNSQLNSFHIPSNSITVEAQCEYYRTLNETQVLTVTVPAGMKSEARIIFSVPNDRITRPIQFNYTGTVNYQEDITAWNTAGTKFVFLYETNSNLYVKLLSTGE